MKSFSILLLSCFLLCAACGTQAEMQPKGPAAVRVETPGIKQSTNTKISPKPVTMPKNQLPARQQSVK